MKGSHEDRKILSIVEYLDINYKDVSESLSVTECLSLTDASLHMLYFYCLLTYFLTCKHTVSSCCLPGTHEWADFQKYTILYCVIAIDKTVSCYTFKHL